MSPAISPNVFKNACGIDCYFQLSLFHCVSDTHICTQHYIFLNTVIRILLLWHGSCIMLIRFAPLVHIQSQMWLIDVRTIVSVATGTNHEPYHNKDIHS